MLRDQKKLTNILMRVSFVLGARVNNLLQCHEHAKVSRVYFLEKYQGHFFLPQKTKNWATVWGGVGRGGGSIVSKE